MSPSSPLFDTGRVEHRRAFLINLLYFAVIAGALFLAVRTLFVWMLPFVFALLVALALQRPVKWLNHKTRLSKKVFSVAFVVLIILILAGLVALIGWRLGESLASYFGNAENIQVIQDTVTSLGDKLQSALAGLASSLPPEAESSLDSAVSNLTSSLIGLLTDGFTSAANWAVGFTSRLPQMLLSFIVWVLASIFLTIDYDQVRAFALRQLPQTPSPPSAHHPRSVPEYSVPAVEGVSTLDADHVCGALRGLGLLRVPYFIGVAALVAVVDILPVLGTGTILLPWAVISADYGGSLPFCGTGPSLCHHHHHPQYPGAADRQPADRPPSSGDPLFHVSGIPSGGTGGDAAAPGRGDGAGSVAEGRPHPSVEIAQFLTKERR